MPIEYMFYIRNAGDAKASLSAESHLAFIKKCEVYIDKLKKEGKLIAAQPLVREGIMISRPNKTWKLHPCGSEKRSSGRILSYPRKRYC